MHAYIIMGGSLESRAEFIANTTTGQTQLVHLAAEKSSITIRQVQDLTHPLSVMARLPRIVWIEEANLLTIPAQNALLKMLEEPPHNTTFYLTCTTQKSLVQTIVSRSQTIALDQVSRDMSADILRELKTMMTLSSGDRLALMQKRDRSESVAWVTQIEHALRDKLHDPNLSEIGAKTLTKIARHALIAHTQLVANCSVSLVTQNFLLGLPKTK